MKHNLKIFFFDGKVITHFRDIHILKILNHFINFEKHDVMINDKFYYSKIKYIFENIFRIVNYLVMKLALVIDTTIDNFLGESLDIQTFLNLPTYHN